MATKPSIIDYTVVQANSYKSRDGQTLTKLSQKSSKPFRFLGESEMYSLLLKLNKPSIITQFEIKVEATDKVELVGEFQKVPKKLCSLTLNIENMRGQPIIEKNPEPGVYDHIEIRLQNLLPTQSIIHYVILRGIADEVKSAKKVHNVSHDDQEFKPDKKPHKERQKEIFTHRKKTRSPSNKKKEEFVIQIDIEDKNNQSEDLRRAIQLSKREQEMNMVPVDEFQFDDPINYDIIPFDSKIEKVIEHTNHKWMEAQRKAEQNINVRQVHSLANKVSIKCFKGLKFCINNIFGSEKTELITSIKNLGGDFMEEPKEDCLLITNKMEGAKIQTARFIKSVKFVRPEFVKDCQKLKMKLPLKEYLF